MPEVGVAGFILGGGYSWKTNRYGLAIDNVQSFELVLPNGTLTTVTSTSNADLFFGLRVRVTYQLYSHAASSLSNKFIGWVQQFCELNGNGTHPRSRLMKIVQGIVTKFVLKTHPQTQVWVSCHNFDRRCFLYSLFYRVGFSPIAGTTPMKLLPPLANSLAPIPTPRLTLSLFTVPPRVR